MITPSREEILLVLKGWLSNYDEVLKKWTDPPTAVKFQILQSDNDFLLRISTDSLTQSDPLVFTSTRNIDSVTRLADTSSLQIKLRAAIPPRNVIFRLRFNSHEDKDHFFLILKNVVEELKSRALYESPVMLPQRPAPAPPSKKPKQGQTRETMAVGTSVMPLMGSSGAESQAKGSEIESLIEALQKKVVGGDCLGASEAAMGLAKKKAKLSISADEVGDMPGNRSKFSLEVCVEDREISGAKIRLNDVIPNMTIGGLKKRVFQQFQFPVEVQRWIIGRRIIKDSETLMESRINSSTPVFLYLISAERAGITREQVQMAQQMQQFRQTLDGRQDLRWVDRTRLPLDRAGWDTEHDRSTGNVMRPGPMPQVGDVIPKAEHNAGPKLPNRGTTRDLPTSPTIPPIHATPKKPTAYEVGWHCPQCTLVNPPTIPGCRACLADRPEDYTIPHIDTYIMDDEEKAKQEELRRNERLMEEMVRRQKLAEAMSRQDNFQALLMVENKDVIPNAEAFECLICYTEVPRGEGVLLRECLHTFCRECLEGHILHNREPVIMCPYNDGTYTCPEALLDREIKALVSPANFQKYLQHGLSVAESQDPNSFHCKTPDCKGFCFYDDNINFFLCPICGKKNCLTCKAIHQGMNCKEYQDDLQRRAANDKAAMMTKNMLEKMIQTGEAMKCPQCGIIMLKKEGCDWIQCSMCKLEVCWVTKGPRWGKAGTGDISGGCKCRVQSRSCHPNCGNCH